MRLSQRQKWKSKNKIVIEYKYIYEVLDTKDELSSLIKDFGEDGWEIQHTNEFGFRQIIDEYWIFDGILKRETVKIKF